MEFESRFIRQEGSEKKTLLVALWGKVGLLEFEPQLGLQVRISQPLQLGF